ncbi:MAG: transglutaminase family protein [Pseudomonadales bacterium]
MSVFRYRARVNRQAMDTTELSTTTYLRETAIDDSNPRIREYAAQLRESYPDVEDMVKAVLDSIRQDPFSYTLSPPLYQSSDSIDEFWFDGRAGFCTHYAGAFVFLMRAAGMPARMVGGYLGGEVNSITGHLVVRQYDAHGWAEVWVAGRGWVRVDPTSAVAPERIEKGIRAALSSADLATLSVFTNARMGKWELLGDALRWADSIEHRWNLWVVGYDTNFQSRFLQDLLGELSPTRIGLAILGGGGLSLGAVAVVLFWRRRGVHRHPVEKAFRRFCDKLAGYGYERRPQESPSGFVRRIAAEVGLTEAQVGGLVAELDTLLYNPGVAWGTRELQALRSQLRRLQFRLAFGASR